MNIVYLSGAPRAPTPPFQCWAGSCQTAPARKTNTRRNKNRPNIKMGGEGGRGVGAGCLDGFGLRVLRTPFLKIGFPLFPPGYGHQNLQTPVLYSTVRDRDCSKHRLVKHIAHHFAHDLHQCSRYSPRPKKISPGACYLHRVCSVALRARWSNPGFAEDSESNRQSSNPA